MEENSDIDPTYVKLLGVIGLSAREAKALLAIITYRTANPTDVAEYSGISKSKIYETMASLVNRGYLAYDGKNYELDPRSLSMLRDNVGDVVSSYSNFVSRMSELHPNVSTRLAHQIEKLFQDLNFDIVSKGPVEFPEDLVLRLQKTRLVVSFMRSITNISAVSPTSGRRVAVLIFSTISAMRRIELDEALDYLSYFFSRVSKFDHDVLFILADQALRQDIRVFEGRMRGEIKFFSLSSDFAPKIKEELVQFDRQWQQKRERLFRLENDIENPNREIMRQNVFLSELRALIVQQEKTSKDRWLFQTLNEILDRVSGDLHAVQDRYMDIRYDYKHLTNSLRDRRRLPTDEQLGGLQNTIQGLVSDFESSSKEASALAEELTYLYRKDSRYQRVGYTINPFVFTVPVEGKLDLVNQEAAFRQISEFVRQLANGTRSRNILFLVDEPGMGKTHLMKFILSEINKGKMGEALGLYLRCPPGSDLMSLFNRLAIAIDSLTDPSLRTVLKSTLMQATPPMTVNDFVDLLRRLSQIAFEKGVQTFVLFIDEFENTISTSRESTIPFLQLRSLLETAHVAYVVSMRRDYWETNLKEADRILAPLGPYAKLELDRFTSDTVKKLLKKRLDLFRDTNLAETVTFSDEAATEIATLAKGNPREVIRNARDAFRLSLAADKRRIESSIVKELASNSVLVPVVPEQQQLA